jgi:hypothetical protein
LITLLKFEVRIRKFENIPLFRLHASQFTLFRRLADRAWAAQARKMGPQALRMNLNTLLRHEVFSVEQLSSTVSEAGTNFTSDKRLRKSFYKLVDYVADRIADESEPT